MSQHAATAKCPYIIATKYGCIYVQNQNQIYSLEQYTVIPTATYGFVPPGCRRGRLATAFPRPHVSGRLAPASAWAVLAWSLPPVCSLPRVCYLPIAILSRLHTILYLGNLLQRQSSILISTHPVLYTEPPEMRRRGTAHGPSAGCLVARRILWVQVLLNSMRLRRRV
jgi:hypothetical protein